MSRALPDGTGLGLDGLRKIALTRMDTLMSVAQVRNTHWTARTRFSRKYNGATEIRFAIITNIWILTRRNFG
jgi:hypothetical protein